MAKSKLTQKDILDLLALVGVKDVEVVEKDEDSDLKTTATTATPVTLNSFLKTVDDSRRPILEPQIITSKKDEINGESTRRLNDALRKKLHELTNIPKDELKDVTDTDEMLKKSIEYHNGIIGKGKEDLVAERDTLMAKHRKALEEVNKDWEKKHGALSEQLTSKEIINALTDMHVKAPNLPKDSNRAMLAKDYYNWLKSAALIKLNDKGEIELYDPAKPDTRLYNSNGTSFATPNDYFTSRYGKDGLNILVNDSRSINPADEMKKIIPATAHAIKTDDGKVLSPIEQQARAAEAWAAAGTANK